MKRCQVCHRNNVTIEHKWWLTDIINYWLLVCDECNLCLEEQMLLILEEMEKE